MKIPRLCLGFAVGVAGLGMLPELPPGPALIALGVLATGLWSLRCPGLAAVALGIVWAALLGAAHLDDRLADTLEGRDIQLTGVITSLPESGDGAVRFLMDVREACLDGGIVTAPRRVRLSWYRAPETTPGAGEIWRLAVRLKRPHGTLNPGGFDYEGWLLAQNVGATGSVRPEGGTRIGTAWDYPNQHARQWLNIRLDAMLAGTRHPELIKALFMGEDSAIRPETWETLRRTGTTHLMVISGSHISLLAGWVFFLTLRLAARLGLQRWSPPRLASACAALSAIGYTALADFAVPAQRAMIMTLVALGAVGLLRAVRPFNALGIALGAVLLADPFAVTQPGFWLSFLAVGLLLYVTVGRANTGGFWRELWRSNWTCALGLLPVLVLLFQQASLLTPIANLVAIPLLGGVAVPLVLLAVFGHLAGLDPSGLLLAGADLWVDGCWRGLEWLAALPAPEWRPPRPGLASVMLALAGVALLLAPRGLPGRGIGLILLLPFLLAPPPRPQDGAFRLTLLDVDQGLSCVVETRNHVLVFDAGARWNPRTDFGRMVVAPFLRQGGWPRIDTLVISHGDADHRGGVPALLDEFAVTRTLSSVPEILPEFARNCVAGQTWEWDGVRFTMLSPTTPDAANDNDASCVLRVEGAAGSALLTGDIEAPAEEALWRTWGDALASTVLIVPHHGSATSSTAEFIQAVRPRWALIPAGYRNRYHHPHPDVVNRYRAQGIPVFASADSGALSIDFTQDAPLQGPRAWRHAARRWWHWQGASD